MMKRLFAVLLCLAALAFSACTDAKPSAAPSEGTAAAATPTEAVTNVPTEATAPSEETTAGITTKVYVPTEATTAVIDDRRSDPDDPHDATGFISVTDVIPDAMLDIRYYSTYNFIGDRVNGYEEPVALMTKEAALALREAADSLREQGYRLKIYDAYRPQTAVDHFASWAEDTGDTRMKEYFYPELDKSVLFDYGYIARYSGHSRGSAVDLTLFDMEAGEDADMGGTFDYFGSLSHPDYTGVSDAQYRNRMTLRSAMLAAGFDPCGTEWWHFTLSDEPYPYTYFDFPVSLSSL